MNANSLTVLAIVKAQAGKENQVRQALLSLVEPSRKDAGCLNYDLHQAAYNPALFMFHENWTGKAHREQPRANPGLQAVLANVAQMVAEPPEITLWNRIA